MSRETTRPRRLNAADLAPFAILALMVVALALVPVFTQYTVRTANVYDIFQNFASYGTVALALGITIIAVSSTSRSRRCTSSEAWSPSSPEAARRWSGSWSPSGQR